MSLVGRVGRKRPRARVAMAGLYLILTLGAITTIYPFLLMISTGLKGPTDQNDTRLVPTYLQKDAELLDKYVDDKYAGDKSLIASTRQGGSPAEVEKYDAFLKTLPIDFWEVGFRIAPGQVTSRLTDLYRTWLRSRYENIDALNRAYVEENVAFQTVVPPSEMFARKVWRPTPGRKYEEWRSFKAGLPTTFRIPITERLLFQKWAMGKYQNQFGEVPLDVKGTATRFEELQVPASGPVLDEFRKQEPDRFRSDAGEAKWAAFGGIGPMPVAPHEAAYVAAHASELRNEFAGRNYRYVLDYILINGRAVANTVLFCVLAILTQLTVNPLAAYALSRYPVRQSGAILIFLLATMAFPAEVAMIPAFLLLKDLGLLNTFAALVLPSAASGYMIFLLKGFFDSLPQELFEAGSLDGAKESTMMFRIALPLSRPVLGYLALVAFMGAYGAFIYAFLVAQDQRIWTLMVWIYQLQNNAPKSVMMAALTLAALPTLIVFLLAQRVIMRGIVLPGER
ncbi:carbohydrate ABC transporter permease [Fimbriimonas ginsengisoli]|uniref:Maltose/maltodextrin ABC transporter, permease protein MalG n=1 Tax=Fimbriimonas ginsengisoli Gsoil 348 TaxID=661478 RepID=A0A068NQM2_FIMGI|nr:carbohydrate ABC transporter permease [Fimbriimonas ginsengisoli]AIE85030.1 Maltose/maltodextrin ABC transporter, permease protein MalG [Fimbriimonas ginsengisoli Gsoil 348]